LVQVSIVQQKPLFRFLVLLQKHRIGCKDPTRGSKVLLRIGTFGRAIIDVFNSTVNTPESRAEGKLVQFLVQDNEIKLGLAYVFTVIFISVLIGETTHFLNK
jgi:hypothetical protein